MQTRDGVEINKSICVSQLYSALLILVEDRLLGDVCV